jgi:hypothetical protein
MDWIPHVNLSAVLPSLGQHERALAEVIEANRLAPSANGYHNEVFEYTCLGRFDQAELAFQKARSMGFDGILLRETKYLLAFLVSDDAGMREQAEWAVDKPGAAERMLWLESATEAYYGRFRAAAKYVSTAILAARKTDASASDSFYRARAALRMAEIGASDAERSEARVLAQESADESTRIELAIALARMGEASEAQTLLDGLAQGFPSSTLIQAYYIPVVTAAIALGGQNPAKAIDALRAAAPYDFADNEPVSEVYPAYLRGLAYLQLRKPLEAEAEFRKLLQHRGLVRNYVTGALAHLQLARAQAMMGDKAAARKSYVDFLTVWKDADPDIPIYRQAKAEYAKLR